MITSPLEREIVSAALPFDTEAIGVSFRELAVDVVCGNETEFISRWYRSFNTDADLMIWVDTEKRIIKHQLSFFGQVVEWSPIGGTRTGVIVESEFDGDVAELIRFDSRAEPAAVRQGQGIIDSIPVLSLEMRREMIFQLRTSPRLHKNARERALKTWAPHVDEFFSDRRPNFWKRLKNWVVGT